MSGKPAWNVEGLRKGLMMLFAERKLEVRRRDDGQLQLRRPGSDAVVILDPVSRRWTIDGREEGVGFVALARRLGLELRDGLAPWLGGVIEWSREEGV